MGEMKYMPLITILIPVYNGGAFLADAIDSAIAQTYPNIDILVINDGSTDNTEEIALSYGNKIRYIKKPNGGVSSVLNMGIDNMRGEWLSWLSHDDRYLPDKVQRQVEKLNELKASGVDIERIILHCNNERIDTNGNVISRKSHIYKEGESIKDTMLNNIRHYNICGCAVLASKRAFEENGYFDEDIPTVSDADMWYRMMLNGYRFIYMDDRLVQSRQHKNQVSHRISDRCLKEQNEIHIKIASELLKVLDSQKDVLKLRLYLTQRGFEEAAELVRNEYICRYGEKNSVVNDIKASYYRMKHKGRNILRDAYRKATLR